MENEVQKKRILSGIQPSGDLTLGSYLGAIRNWAALADEYDCYYMMADMHTITVRQVPAELRRHTLVQLAAYIASGLDRRKTCCSSSLMFLPTPSWAGCWTATPCSAS